MLNSKIVKHSYTEGDARGILMNCDKNINIVAAKEVYYPYLYIRYKISIGKRSWSKLDKLCDCIIDLVAGSVAEGKGSPEFIDISIEDTFALKQKVSESECMRMGHDFVLKQQLSKAKLLQTAEFTILRKEYFHKRFYILKCLDDEEREYYTMIDAISGALSVLDN